MPKPLPRLPALTLGLLLGLCALPALSGDGPSASLTLTTPRSTDTALPTWSALADPALDGLLAQALAGNPDIAEALARLQRARAAAGLSATARLPTGDLTVARQRDRPPGDPWAASASLAWEVDLFGRLGHAQRAAQLDAEAAASGHAAVRNAIAADVARTWFQLVGAQALRELRERAMLTQSEVTVQIADRVGLGGATPDAAARARAQLASDRAALLEADDTVVALEARLAVLVGAKPGHWRAPAAATLAPLRLQPLALPAESALLTGRPEVEAAALQGAARRAAATAAARARLPRLSLVGVLGFLAGDLGSLLRDSAAREASATLGWDLLGQPRLAAEQRIAEAEVAIADARHEAARLAALEDASVALQRHASAGARAEARIGAALAAHEAAATVQSRFEEGAAAYFEALSARRDALTAEEAAIAALVAQRTATIDVLRALGVAPAAEPGQARGP